MKFCKILLSILALTLTQGMLIAECNCKSKSKTAVVEETVDPSQAALEEDDLEFEEA